LYLDDIAASNAGQAQSPVTNNVPAGNTFVFVPTNSGDLSAVRLRATSGTNSSLGAVPPRHRDEPAAHNDSIRGSAGPFRQPVPGKLQRGKLSKRHTFPVVKGVGSVRALGNGHDGNCSNHCLQYSIPRHNHQQRKPPVFPDQSELKKGVRPKSFKRRKGRARHSVRAGFCIRMRGAHGVTHPTQTALANFPQTGYSQSMKRNSFVSRLCYSPTLRHAAVMLIVLIWSSLAFCGEIHDAAWGGDLEKVKALLKKNPDLVFSKDDFGHTPLYLAAASGRKNVVELLLANKADVNVTNNNGETPLRKAVVKGGNYDLQELLRQHGGHE
jgi:hypothetical protein